ncbi:hypothetical protein CANINC_002061 [Pichia inconspicua]|uniref:Uncharacterized protein n=1 Tax=Pichia inconspicua TaxID=52247 RepID=A0A4T0X2L5_9ASCO|nr:hypothetical protein CANINC_002061 [[Candida] inconspicua]
MISTKGLGIVYDSMYPYRVIAYTDADHSGDKTDFVSVRGTVLMYANGLISWKSKKGRVAQSSTEAELGGFVQTANIKQRREGRQIEYVIRQSLSTNILDSLDKRCSSSIDLNSVMMMAHIMDIVGVSLDANRNLCDTKLMDNGYQELKDEFKNLVEEVNENLRCGPHSGRKSSAKIANQLGVNPEDIRNAGGWNTEEFITVPDELVQAVFPWLEDYEFPSGNNKIKSVLNMVSKVLLQDMPYFFEIYPTHILRFHGVFKENLYLQYQKDVLLSMNNARVDIEGVTLLRRFDRNNQYVISSLVQVKRDITRFVSVLDGDTINDKMATLASSLYRTASRKMRGTLHELTEKYRTVQKALEDIRKTSKKNATRLQRLTNVFVAEAEGVGDKNVEILKETQKALNRFTTQFTSNPRKRRRVSRLRITSPTPTYDVISPSVRTSGVSSQVESEGEEHTQEEGSHTDDYQSLNAYVTQTITLYQLRESCYDDHPDNDHPDNDHPDNDHPDNDHPDDDHPDNDHPDNINYSDTRPFKFPRKLSFSLQIRFWLSGDRQTKGKGLNGLKIEMIGAL